MAPPRSLSRATHDIGNLSWVASMLSGSVVTIPVLFLGGVLLAMRKDTVLALIMLVFVPVVFVIVTVIGRKIEPLWVISDSYVDKQNDIVRERLHGIRVIRAFNSEPREHNASTRPRMSWPITSSTRTSAWDSSRR